MPLGDVALVVGGERARRRELAGEQPHTEWAAVDAGQVAPLAQRQQVGTGVVEDAESLTKDGAASAVASSCPMIRIVIALLALVSCKGTGPAAPRLEPSAASSAAASVPASPGAIWCIHKLADNAGNLVFVTVDLQYKKYQRKADWPYLLHVNVVTRDQNANGHPTPNEGAVLNRVEDSIATTLHEATPVLFIGRATTKGFRELMFVVSNAEAANAALQQMTATAQERPWEFRVVKDPQWTHVQPILDSDAECL